MELGRFIAFEGGEGVGKSTQARLLAEALAARGVRCRLTREPGGSEGAEAIRALLLSPPGAGWGAEAEALLFAAARADHVARLIRPALAAGEWVICDRFVDSSRAYQGAAGELGDAAVRQLHEIGSGGLLPDLAIILAATSQRVSERLLSRDGFASDAIGGRDASYHERVSAAFRAFATGEPDRFVSIVSDGSVEDVHRLVLERVLALC